MVPKDHIAQLSINNVLINFYKKIYLYKYNYNGDLVNYNYSIN